MMLQAARQDTAARRGRRRAGSGRRLSALLVLASLAVSLAPVHAQSRSGGPDDPRYYVEILVFQRDTATEPLYRFPGEPAVDQALALWPLVETRLYYDPQTARLEREPAGGRPDFSYGQWSGQRPGTGLAEPAGPRPDGPFDRQPRSADSSLARPGEALPPPAPASLARSAPLLPVTDLFVAMPEASLIMVREWRALDAEPGLTPLIQRGWHQPAATFGDPQPVRVFGGPLLDRQQQDSAGMLLGARASEPVFAVDGTVALERGRFLHLRIDLALHRKDRRGAPHYDDMQTLQQPGNHTTHRITQRRQVTLDAVNYFDHRFFGVVALVKQWPPDGGEAQEDP